MKKKNRRSSLKEKIWLYLTLFSFIILICLWLFQVVFLNSYYQWYKKRDTSQIISYIQKNYNPNTIEELLDDISYKKGVCIEIINNSETTYSSDKFNRGCMILNKKEPLLEKDDDIVDKSGGAIKSNKHEENKEMLAFQEEFISSKKTKDSIVLLNPRFRNQTLIYGLKLKKDGYAFISASMQPLDATTKILTSQFIYVTTGVLFLSFLIGYLISKRISKPIVKINNAAKKMANGEYDVVFETGENITELNELADTLNHTRDELAGTEELRRELLANVSHDIKTPLTMIKAYAEMVRDLSYKDDIKRTEHLNVIMEESDRLNLLVNDILELSRMQSNIDILNQQEFDINDLVSAIINRFKILTDLEGYKFAISGSKNLIVIGDIKKIEQVIYNLIGNAINYTGNDKLVTVKIKDLDDTVLISIIDTGKGINAEDINKIWDKYYKSDKKHKRNAYGTGIGLSIVKQILESHAVNYGVTSKLNKGTTFYFELPKKS